MVKKYVRFDIGSGGQFVNKIIISLLINKINASEPGLEWHHRFLICKRLIEQPTQINYVS